MKILTFIQNQFFWIFSKLGLSSPTTCIDIIWTSHMRSSWNTTLILLHMGGQETTSYKFEIALISNIKFKV